MAGKETRYRKLFGESGKAVVVAADHGMFDGPHKGMEDIPAMLKTIGHEADGVLLSPGTLSGAGAYFGRRGAPVAIARLNFNSVFCFTWSYDEAVVSNLFQPEDAVEAGADWVLVCLTLRTGSEATDARNAEIFADLCLKSHRLGIPVLGEYFPKGHLAKSPDEFHEEVLIGCRMLSELGADAIKTFNTNNFKEVTSTCPIPILGLGAEKTPTDLDALRLAEEEVTAGAAGVVFGRNAIQATNPPEFIAGLQDIVKKGMKAEDVVKARSLH